MVLRDGAERQVPTDHSCTGVSEFAAVGALYIHPAASGGMEAPTPPDLAIVRGVPVVPVLLVMKQLLVRDGVSLGVCAKPGVKNWFVLSRVGVTVVITKN
jgi:hypothetical protein